jgi:hypothetical protein
MISSLALSSIVAVSAQGVEKSVLWSPFYYMNGEWSDPFNMLNIIPDADKLSAHFIFGDRLKSILNVVGDAGEMADDILNTLCFWNVTCQQKIRDSLKIFVDVIDSLDDINAMLALQADGEGKFSDKAAIGLFVDGAAFAVSNIGGYEHVAASVNGDAGLHLNFGLDVLKGNFGFKFDSEGDVKFNSEIYQEIQLNNSTLSLALDAAWSAATKISDPEGGVQTVATISNGMKVTFTAYNNGTLSIFGSNLSANASNPQICYRSFVAECKGEADFTPSRDLAEEENARELLENISGKNNGKKTIFGIFLVEQWKMYGTSKFRAAVPTIDHRNRRRAGTCSRADSSGRSSTSCRNSTRCRRSTYCHRRIRRARQ